MGPGGAVGSQGQWPKRASKRRNRIADLTVSVALPWLVFFLVTSLFVFAYHEMKLVVWILTGLCLCLAMLFLILGVHGRHATFLAIGFTCLTSVIVATVLGVWLNGQYLERYYQLESGQEYQDVDPTSDPTTTKDAAIINFAAEAFVDDSRTLGFVADGAIFCAAPVVTPPYYTTEVSYWAVGSDCCQQRSGFDCGTARDLGSTSALIEPWQSRYADAVAEASSVYGLPSMKGAQLVSFVYKPQTVVNNLWEETLTIALIASLMDFLICLFAGVVIARISPAQTSERTPLRK